MRWLWRTTVPGTSLAVFCWLVFLSVDIWLDRPGAIIGDALFLVLNLYSWDWQRRRAAGQVMP